MLEANCTKVSIKGLLKDHPKSYKLLRDLCLEGEYYLILEALENRRDKIDKEYFIFITKQDKYPVAVQKKEQYTLEQGRQICDLACLDRELLKSYLEVTPANISNK